MYTIQSSNGTLTLNEYGYVIARDTIDESLLQITRIDLDEWRHYWDRLRVPAVLDILDVGYWYYGPNNKIIYEPASHDWRTEIAANINLKAPGH